METVIQESQASHTNKLTVVCLPCPVLWDDAHLSTSMTLGHVYDLDLKKNEGSIKEVIIQAQGEVLSPNFIIFDEFLTLY